MDNPNIIEEVEEIESSAPPILKEDTENKEDRKESKASTTEDIVKSNKIQISKGVIYIGIAIIITLIAIIAYLATRDGGNGTSGQQVDLPLVSDAAGIVVSGEDRDSLLSKIDVALTDIESRNIMLNVVDSSNSSVTMVYNSYGEAVAEAPDTGHKTVYLDDNRTIRFASQIGYGYDSEVITLMRIVANMATEDTDIPVLKAVEVASVEGNPEAEAFELSIDIRGWDNITKLYSTIDTGFAEVMVGQLKDSIALAASSSSTISDTDELNLRIVYIIAEDSLQAGACYIFIGDKESGYITWDDLSHNWVFNSYLELYDWKLDEQWYSLDWESIESWAEDGEEMALVEELFLGMYQSLVDMLNQFAEDNGISENMYSVGTSGADLVENNTNSENTTDSEVDDSELEE